MEQEETLELTDEPDPDEDRAAVRAALADRYERDKQKAVDSSDEDATDGTDGDEPVSLEEQGRGTITDIEADEDLGTDDINVLLNDAKNVSAIRFELDGERYTPWYEWAPHDKTHELTKVVDYYADGDLTNMVGETVGIHSLGASDSVLLSFPRPYTSRLAHLKYPILRWARQGIPEDDPSTMTTIETKSTVVHDDQVLPQTSTSYGLTSEGGMALGLLLTIPFIPFLLGALVIAGQTAVLSVAAVGLATLLTVGTVFGQPWSTTIGGPILTAVLAVAFPLGYAWKLITAGVRRVATINKKNPFDN